jgi:gliding motility-associated-like protein
MKKILFLTFLSVFLFPTVKASHLMGGEITWECLSTGKYVFTMKIYRDCNGTTIGTGAQSLETSNGCPVSTIPMNYVFPSRDISPQCYSPALQKSCGPQLANGSYGSVNFPNNNGAVEEMIFRSNPITLAGVPGVNGWVFSWSLCCRNAAITNLSNPGSAGFCLRAKMFRFNNPNGTPKNTNPCFDNSPQFAERPSTIICTGFPFTYNHNAYDKELDSLTYVWDKPLDEYTGGNFNATNPAALGFSAGYLFSSPLPGVVHDPNNIPATVDLHTGEISYTSFTQGNFVTVVKVTAFKCGQKVAEIYRELQVVLLPCGTGNNPPNIIAPFPTTLTPYSKTVLAGDTVRFDLFATDNDLLPTGNPQTISITASGGQFDVLTYDTLSTNCNKPPCAGLYPPPPILSATGTAQAKFVWKTNCDHISYLAGCATYSNTYSFLVTYRDDYCPAPALKVKTITIKVLAKAIIKAPELRCAKVAANGDVKLTWIAPHDTDNTFAAYVIYGSNNYNGPYTAIDSLEADSGKTIDSTSIWHVGAGANTTPMYYYVKSRSGCWGRIYSLQSNIIKTMKLSVTNIGNNQASLVWNSPTNPLMNSVIGNYKVFRKVNNIWSQIGTTSDTTYLDTIAVCNEFVEYQIELEDSACVSSSSIAGDTFIDTVVPDTPILSVVSVNSTSDLAEISWFPTIAADTEGYYIYQFSGGSYSLIDTVLGINNNFYTYNLSNASTLPESYAVAAFDSCGNISAISTSFTTMHLQNINDVCSGSNNLRWTAYVDFPGGVDTYTIYVRTNFGSYSPLVVVDATTLTYKHTGLTNGTFYDYYIIASEFGTTTRSSTNHVSQQASVLELPKFTYVRYATVTDDKQVDLAYIADTSATVKEFKIYRATEVNGTYEYLSSIVPDTSNYTQYYTDLGVEPDARSYFYKIIAVDSCGVDGPTSNTAKTILLKADEILDLKNLIKWSDYKGWSTGIKDVKLFRYVNSTINPEPISFIPFATNEYIDDVSDYSSYSGEFCYSVVAREAAGNIYSFADSAQSNIVCFNQQSTIYIPNAFNPSGTNNPVFKPHFVFVNTDGFLLRIFNRWGALMFETTNPEKGWDGKIDGEIVPQGAYVYVMKYKNTDGASFEKRGAVTIIK